jgi:hypothetical protein
MVVTMELESEHNLRPGVHPIADNSNGDDMGSEESQTLEPPVPQLISLGVLFLATLAIIIAGYFHNNMHLITTLKNATQP